MSETISVNVEDFKRLVLMAKNDAMMMEAFTRHNPIGDATEAQRASAEDDMTFVNRAARWCGLEPPFWEEGA